MELKSTQTGPRAGDSFWGCPRFPECQGSLSIFDDPRLKGAVNAHDGDVKEDLFAPPAELPPAFAAIAGQLQLRLGGFVWTDDRALLGKLIELLPDRAVVRIVHSIAEREERIYDPVALRRASLSPQSRVYVFDEDRDRWIAGRVVNYDMAHDETGPSYEVRLPGQDDRVFRESEIEARCFEPTIDPTEILASGGEETQFFYDRRLAALRELLGQRAATAGVSGLVSASVDLLPHQFHVVRQVLEDPVQRYLLADEVGLGKTIEAGGIARQLLNELPGARVAVVVPPALVWQWRQELRDKFDLDPDDEAVTVVGTPDLGEIVAEADSFDLLIVDEAHHLVGHGGAELVEYQQLSTLAQAIERVLLLTATPVLSNDSATLALLHLLDPVAHPLDDTDGFRSKLDRRQRYGELLLTLDPGVPAALLRPTVDQLRELLPEDEELAALGGGVLDEGATPDERSAAIISLRHHVADTYRLHQRLLRTRRADAGWGDRSCEVTAEVDDDERAHELWTLLEQWRLDALDQVGTDDAAILQAADTFAALFEAIGRGVEEFETALGEREALLSSSGSPAFADEPSWIATCQEICDQPAEGMERLELCVEVIRLALRGQVGDEPARFVAFTSSTDFAEELTEALSVLRTTTVSMVTAGLDHEELEDAVDSFLESDWPAVLVSDRVGEEGLNLQRADGVLHTDLPLAPARLEQRIGRLDRLGRTRSDIPTRVILPSDDDGSPWLAWYELLADGLGLFSRSISDVQFLLDELEQDMRIGLFQGGARGLSELSAEIGERLVAERRVLDQQYALERLDIDSRDAVQAFEAAKRADAREVPFEDAINGWAHEVLQLRRDDIDRSMFRIRWTKKTLAPENPWEELFEMALDRPLTYRRDVALADPGVRLVRSGFALIDELHRFMRRDDRGTAYASWRTDPRFPEEEGDWLGFRLTYLIELNEDRLRELIHTIDPEIPFEPIRRTAMDIFAPWLETLNLDAGLEVVTGQLTEEIMRREYDRRHDLNLAARPDLMESVVGWERFAELCRTVRTSSEERLRETPAFDQRLTQQRQLALHTITGRLGRLRRRAAALDRMGEEDASIERQIAITEALEEVAQAPRVRLEAIGALIVSNRRAPAVI